ncbi:hypothetical protein ACFQ1L_12235 [Phytohabitans flavus]|uniref:hypothetical protein n=1 Tax=Phytohabitans flavus TaxID=1076124 RepID=UPI003638A717
MLTRRALITSSAAAALTAATLTVPGAASAHGSRHRRFPDTFPLPNAFQPEGIAIGRAPFAYFGSSPPALSTVPASSPAGARSSPKAPAPRRWA